MDLKEGLIHIKDALIVTVPQRNLRDFLNSLPKQDSRRILSKKDIAARIQNLPFEANDLFRQRFGQLPQDKSVAFPDEYGNTWQIYSNDAREMKISVKNENGYFNLTSSYISTPHGNIKKEYGALLTPDKNKILVEYTNVENIVSIATPLKRPKPQDAI